MALPFPTLVILCFVSNQLLPFLPIVSKLSMSKKICLKKGVKQSQHKAEKAETPL